MIDLSVIIVNFNVKEFLENAIISIKNATRHLNVELFVVDNITIESGKTKDATAFVNELGQRDVLVVKELIDDKTFLAFRNLQNAYLVEANELNAYLAAAYHSVVIEKAVWEKLTKES